MNLNPLEKISTQDFQLNSLQAEKTSVKQDDISQTKTAIITDDTKQIEASLKNSDELKKLIEELQNKISYLNKSLKIEFDKDINEPIIKIVEINTNKVIRQIPPDYVVNIIKNINKMIGAIFNEKI